MASTPESLRAVWLGRMGFEEALALQLAARERVVAGEPGVLFLVEHPPVLTLGRRGKMEDILWSAEERAAAGVTVSEAPRGGEVTLHGPGQLVAYPVVMVGRRIREHIVRLGEVAIELLRELGVDGCEFRMEHPGVWRGSEKLASIGIHVSRDGGPVPGCLEPIVQSAGAREEAHDLPPPHSRLGSIARGDAGRLPWHLPPRAGISST